MIRGPVSHTKLRLPRWMIRCSAAARSAVATCSLARLRSPAMRACLFFLTHCGTDSVAIDSATLDSQVHHIRSTHQSKHHITDLQNSLRILQTDTCTPISSNNFLMRVMRSSASRPVPETSCGLRAHGVLRRTRPKEMGNCCRR